MKGMKTGGRTKGTPNKTTAVVKDVIEKVAHDLGGAARMLKWTKQDPVNERIFWKDIYPRLLPLQVNGDFTHEHTGGISPETQQLVDELRGLGRISAQPPALPH